MANEGRINLADSDDPELLRRRLRQLEQDEERYLSLVEKAQLAIVVAQDGLLRYANSQACLLVGRPAERLLAAPFEHLIHPSDRELVMARHAKLMGGQEAPEAYSFRILDANDSTRWIEARTKNIDWQDRPATLALLTDITDQKRAGQALAVSESRYHLLAEHTSDVIWSYDLATGRLSYVSPSVEKIFGYKAEEALELSLEEWNTPESAQKLLAALAEELRCPPSGDSTPIPEIEVMQYRKDGIAIPVGITATLLRDTQGTPLSVVGVSRDISERKRAEEALSARDALLATIYRAAPVGIGVVSAQRIITWANEHMSEMTGYSLAELQGMPAREIYPDEEEFVRVGREKHAEVRAKGVGSVETVWRRKDGSLINVKLSSAQLAEDFNQGLVFTALDITRLKDAQDELKASLARLQILYDRSPVMLHSVDKNFRLISVNERWLEVMGYQRGEVIGRSFGDFLTPESREYAIGKAWPKFLHEGSAKDVSYQMIKKNGQVMDVISNASSERDQDGKVLRTLSVVEDVTQRKRAERELRLSQEKFEKAFRSSPVWVAITSVQDGRFLEVNDSFSQITGYTREEAVGRTSHDLGFWPGPDDRKLALDIYRRQGYFRDLEVKMRYKDGKVHTLLWSADPIEYEGGHCWINVLTDITERKEAELALRESEKSVRLLFEQMVSGFALHEIICDQVGEPVDFRYLDANPAFERHTGLNRRDILEKTAKEVLPGIDQELIAAYGEVALSGQPKQMEYYSKDLDRHYEISAFCPRRGQFAVTFSDVSSRKKTEEQKAALEAQLLQAHKLEAIGTLAGGIAHDFNNILSAIIGYTELVLDDLPPHSEPASNAAQVMQAGLRARDLVKQILAFSRRSEQQRHPLRITPLIKEALKLLRSSLPATIQLVSHLPSKEPTVLADPTQVQQVLMNLCTNAAQAMHPQGGVLRVELYEELLPLGDLTRTWDIQPGNYLVLEVRDSGHGIETEALDKIFEPYYTSKEPGEGTGLGLAVVHGIVTSHGGAIQVSSQPGRGSVFRVFLPASDEEPARLDRPSSEPFAGGHERIMFVDDEESLCRAWSFKLRGLGYKVRYFSDPHKAEAAFRQDPSRYDLLITDQTMPGLLGSDLIRRLMETRPDLPVILCTGHSQTIDERRAREMGANAFLMKPYTSRRLAKTIRQVLD